MMINKFKGNSWEFVENKRTQPSFKVKVDELRGNQAHLVRPGMVVIPDRWTKNGWKYIKTENDLVTSAQKSKQLELSHDPLNHRPNNTSVLVTDKWNKDGWKYVDVQQ